MHRHTIYNYNELTFKSQRQKNKQAMLNARSSAFYTGAFVATPVTPNTPYLALSDLKTAMDYYCAPATFDGFKCATFAQHYGERVGVLAPPPTVAPIYSGLLQQTVVTDATAAATSATTELQVSQSTLAAALYALSGTTSNASSQCAPRK